ncbi:chemotaxis protein CheB [Fusibacter bizertensis]|uniref:Chemotaxis protein CheB n=1 Tax=Fusibacter bizertensis TaxID=1488331 RepID=A0ABT6NE63_9FIRM|nr:chemotaxis protein CheB [Fusibacter bizertensis]MDH8678713.1 chemotaxis protein CheB [Fusibacter bizertensis]
MEVPNEMTTVKGNNENFPIVGIGASAGGLAAFEAFFTGMPQDKDPNMAFILVQHLAPDHKSILTEIIKRFTKMQVFEVEDGMTVKPNCAYIIPPNRDMAFLNGSLQLFEQSTPRGQQMPIDLFFRSLASDLHERAICIILSGTGSDGTLGLRAIKAEGGMAIAQSPDTTEYDGMPMSAISTGLVDYQLPPIDMAKQLITYVAHAYRHPMHHEADLQPKEENFLKKVFILLRTQTGHDFSKYKPSTINRRIERRLAVHQIENIELYVKFLQQTPDEVDALFRDLLIGVTAFFRDKDAYKKLEEDVIPKILEGKATGSNIRVWCTGCSTGEEAYSIAILLYESMEKLKKNFNVQIFATDIDGHAISIARAGLYPHSIDQDLTPDRLSRFFTKEPGSNDFRINKTIRSMLIFSEQSVIKDPPFSKLDLISCRNLLIYLSSTLQKKVIPLFHYALNPKGVLFLGSSETIGDFDTLFDALDRKLKIYQRKTDYKGNQTAALNQILTQKEELDTASQPKTTKTTALVKTPLKDLTEQAILRESTMAGILINDHGDILYLHGRTGMYLEPSQGISGINNIIKMAREGLKRDLTLALHKIKVKKETVRITDINVKTNGHFTKVNMTMKHVAAGLIDADDKPNFIVLLEESKVQTTTEELKSDTGEPGADLYTNIEELKAELLIKEEYLQTANEELETSNEELKSSNEEMQSVNEELQSTNEELETSKEELQSINEELSTVNTELQTKVHDLLQVNNDMNNLLAGTNIATIFLDYQQNILRFTPKSNEIINLILSDVGRPIAHIVSNLIDYKQLSSDVKAVLDTLVPKKIQVQSSDGKWYEMLIQPYRTSENVIEGTVLTFIDITDTKTAKDLLAISEMNYRSLFENAKEGILVLDGDTGKIKNVNPFLIDLLGFSEKEMLEKEIWDIGFFKDIISSKETFSKLKDTAYIRYDDLPLETASGEKIEVEFISNAYDIGRNKIIQCFIRDIASRNKD